MNICTFCPGRDYVTLNFSMEQRHIDNVDKVLNLLEEAERRDVTPHTMMPSVERLH
ncbi:hypothetical protein D3C87_2190720 [compost metagenome]